MSAFRKNLAQDPAGEDFRFLFHVCGNAGVGKTSLLRQWEEFARTQVEAATAYVDDSVHSPVEAMEAVAERLGRQGAAFRRFGKLLEVYRQRAHEAQRAFGGQASAEGPAGEMSAGASSSASLAAQVGLVGLGMVPGVGAFVGAVNPQHMAQGADKLWAALGSRLPSHDDVRLVLDPVGVLTPVFLGELAEVSRKRPWVILFFDVYERTGPVLGEWLRDIACNDVYGELPNNVQLVLSGQGRLDARCWGDWVDQVCEIPLEVFTEEETRTLLALQGVTDERVTEVVLRLSGGLPVLVHTLAQARPSSAEAVDDPSGTAVERFLKWENDPARRNAALACALPLEFDEDVFRAVVPAEAAEEYGWLRQLAFVTNRSGRCRYHEVVRVPMLRHQRTRSPTRWRETHQALAEFFQAAQEQREEVLARDDPWGDTQWREWRAQETYHRLCADPGRALPEALAETAEACGQGEGALRRWGQLLAQAGEDGDDARVREWGQRLAAGAGNNSGANSPDGSAASRLELTHAGDTLTSVLDALLAATELALAGRLRVHCIRGLQHARADRYEPALADFRSAIALDRERTDGWEGLARTLLDAGRAEESLAAWNEVVRLEPDRAEHRTYRGWLRRRLGLRADALDDLDQAIALDPRQDWAYVNRAMLRREVGEAPAALDDLEQALAIDPFYVGAHVERSRCLQDLERWDEAEHVMREAAELEQDGDESVWIRLNLASMLLSFGRDADALMEIDRAMLTPRHGELDAPWGSWAHGLRGWALHGLGGREDEALDDLDRAAQTGGWTPMASVMRGWLLWEAGRLDKAEEEFSRALAHDPKYPWCLGGRAIVRVYAERYAEATADLTDAFAHLLEIPKSDAEAAIARPVVSLLRTHLPGNRAAVTAAIRLVALNTHQLRWPRLTAQVASVVALRPSPRLVIAALGVLRGIVETVRALEGQQARTEGHRNPEEIEDSTDTLRAPWKRPEWRRSWALRVMGPLLHIVERLPGVRGST
ncbi:tetratricopeptide repeat protein [Streptomyces sp. S3(2020)]|uniref:tetratricopeptide repeat protein n=1 Tax=Streptomyces sp. S3(2020) TaxID=2732044 RepID=UPI00148815E5|nr:tetratricopeptide repeat protein [Streptomyces sp. S3(2020)]NNN34402.1 tetratricopeptide repeat protein [Streptomyces sp. S3(2020)]